MLLPPLGAVIGTAQQNGNKIGRIFRIFHMKFTSIPMEVDQKRQIIQIV
jgi:hypothetical protein